MACTVDVDELEGAGAPSALGHARALGAGGEHASVGAEDGQGGGDGLRDRRGEDDLAGRGPHEVGHGAARLLDEVSDHKGAIMGPAGVGLGDLEHLGHRRRHLGAER